jgi:hypothetical protein
VRGSNHKPPGLPLITIIHILGKKVLTKRLCVSHISPYHGIGSQLPIRMIAATIPQTDPEIALPIFKNRYAFRDAIDDRWYKKD